ncbi:MAG: RsmB/NOP family class I SAM-dependent RNA methyltransferase [Bacteroidota bacterium]|jgi:16S rRNA (cytosine967-C5)-methyltransferase
MKFTSQLEHTFTLLLSIDESTQPPDNTTQQYFRSRRYLGSHDRQYISETVFGMLRAKRSIEVLSNEYLNQHSLSLSLSSATLKYLPQYVAYKIACEQTTPEEIRQHLGSYWSTSAIDIDLGHYAEWLSDHKTFDFLAGDAAGKLGIRYSFQDWMVNEWFAQFGSETEQLLRGLNAQARTTLRVNLLRVSREECRQQLQIEGIQAEPAKYSPAGLVCSKRFNRDASRAFKNGCFEFQDEGSQLISIIAGPEPGMRVVDACAGAGGKTLHLAELMDDTGEILAIDIERRRLTELESRAGRAGIRCIRTKVPGELHREEDAKRADLVLVDAPCTGVGTIRRNPWRKWSVTETLVQQQAEEQLNILKTNSELVKLDGRLVYATCSLFRKENEHVVNAFLNSHKDFVVEDPGPRLQRMNISNGGSMFKLLPHLHDTDGFFIAVMRRTG